MLTNKIIGWVMLVANLYMILYALTSPSQQMPVFVALVYVLETYITIKFLESLKK